MDKSTQVVPSRASSDRLLDEGIVLVVDAAAAERVRITAKTAIRWCLAGVRGIRLENVKIAGRRMTSRAAIRRFFAATQPTPASQPPGIDRLGADQILKGFGL